MRTDVVAAPLPSVQTRHGIGDSPVLGVGALARSDGASLAERCHARQWNGIEGAVAPEYTGGMERRKKRVLSHMHSDLVDVQSNKPESIRHLKALKGRTRADGKSHQSQSKDRPPQS